MKDHIDTPAIAMETDALRLVWADGAEGVFPYLWLRDNCPSAFHPETQERIADILQVPETPKPEAAVIDGDSLRIDWAGDGHVSRFTLDWLFAYRPGAASHDRAAYNPVVWTGDIGGDAIPRYSANDFDDPATFAAWIEDTARYGISIVSDVPGVSGAGADLARRIGFLRETNFGVTFEVMNKPNPNNIAYTAHALPLHTDLPNQELTPGYQFLHCLANEAEGGGSVFADGYALAASLRDTDPEAFDLLARTAIPFRFHDGDCDIRSKHPVIVLDHDGNVSSLNWSIHLGAPFDMPAAQMIPYYRAYRAFAKLTQDPAFQVTLRLRGGDMAVFDNRRILHGRAAFDPSTGFRHLQGYYVDRGEFDSMRRVIARG